MFSPAPSLLARPTSRAPCPLPLHPPSSLSTSPSSSLARSAPTRTVSNRHGVLRSTSASFCIVPTSLLPANLKHAREMIRTAVGGDGGAKPKPDLVVLPVSYSPSIVPTNTSTGLVSRNASTLCTAMFTFRCMQRPLATRPDNGTTSTSQRARASGCSQLLQRRKVFGLSEVCHTFGRIWRRILINGPVAGLHRLNP